MLGCVSNAGETVGVVTSIRSDFPVLVGNGCAAATRVIAEAAKRGVWIGDLGEAVAEVICKGDAVLKGVDHGSAIPTQIVFIVGDVRLSITDRTDQKGWENVSSAPVSFRPGSPVAICASCSRSNPAACQWSRT